MRVDSVVDEPAAEQRALSERFVMTTEPVTFPKKTKVREKL